MRFAMAILRYTAASQERGSPWDVRVHGETVVVRAVASLDGMSARYSPLPHGLLAEISTEITNSLKGHVNRVVYDITHKPPGTIEWE